MTIGSVDIKGGLALSGTALTPNVPSFQITLRTSMQPMGVKSKPALRGPDHKPRYSSQLAHFLPMAAMIIQMEIPMADTSNITAKKLSILARDE